MARWAVVVVVLWHWSGRPEFNVVLLFVEIYQYYNNLHVNLLPSAIKTVDVHIEIFYLIISLEDVESKFVLHDDLLMCTIFIIAWSLTVLLF